MNNRAEQSVEIFVATHKKFNMPTDDPIYIPIQGGAKLYPELKLGYCSDAVGNNISEKKEWYNELTSFYWAWKNSDADIKGLCHYRRFFFDTTYSVEKKHLLSKEKIIKTLSTNDIILPTPYIHRGYTVREAFTLSGNADQYALQVCERVLKEVYPDYAKAFDMVMENDSLSMCNSLIADRTVFDSYAEWLFTILFKCEPYLDLENREGQQRRIMGYLGERLLNVWIKKNSLKVKYFALNNIEIDKNIKYYLKITFEMFQNYAKRCKQHILINGGVSNGSF